MDRISELIENIRKFGIENDVPIMSIDTIDTINTVVNNNKLESILEIGTAIGYSTLCFATNKNIKRIVSIERDLNRYNIAKNNVKESKLENIILKNEDALETQIDDKFDLVIIDAAKSQNLKFFNKYKNNLSDKGIIIVDNLDFHGYVGNSKNIKSRNLRQMVRKIEKFLIFLDEQNEFDVEIIKVGDTIAVCKKKNF